MRTCQSRVSREITARRSQLADESSLAKPHDVTTGAHPDLWSAILTDLPRRAAYGWRSETIARSPGNWPPLPVTASSAEARPGRPYTRLGPGHDHLDRDLPREPAIDRHRSPRVRPLAANRRARPLAREHWARPRSRPLHWIGNPGPPVGTIVAEPSHSPPIRRAAARYQSAR